MLLLVSPPIFTIVQVLFCLPLCSKVNVGFLQANSPFVCLVTFFYLNVTRLNKLILSARRRIASVYRVHWLTEHLLFDCRVFHEAPGDWVTAILQRMWEPSLFWIQKVSERHFKRTTFNFLPPPSPDSLITLTHLSVLQIKMGDFVYKVI